MDPMCTELPCPFHPGEDVVLQCSDCPGNTLVCRICITQLHDGHRFEQISKETHKKKVRKSKKKKKNTVPISKETHENTIPISKETHENTVPVSKETHENTVPISKDTHENTVPNLDYKRKFDFTELTLDIYLSIVQKLKETAEKCQDQMFTVKDQAEQIKQLVDIMTAKHVSKIESDLKKSKKHLKRQKSELEKIKQEPSCVPEISTTTTTHFSTGTEDLQLATINSTKTLCLPDQQIAIHRFLPCSDPRPFIEQAFQSEDPRPFIEQAFGHIEETHVPLSSYLRRPSIQSRRSLVQSIAMSPFESSLNLLSTSPVTHTTSSTLRFYSGPNNPNAAHEGQILKTLKLNVQVWKICLHPVTDDLYCCSKEDNSVRQINKDTGDTKVLFYTKTEPWSVGCTIEHIIVGLDKKVCMYTFQGDIVHSYDTVHTTSNISVCKESGRIALTCGFGGVIVLDKTFEFIGRYTGEEELNVVES